MSGVDAARVLEPSTVRSRLEDDSGTRPLEADTVGDFVALLLADGRGVEAKRNPVLRWFAASTPWLTLRYLVWRVAGVCRRRCVQWRRRRAAMLLLALASLGQGGGPGAVLAHRPFRYLHPPRRCSCWPLGGLCGVLSRPPAAPDGDGGRSTSAS